MFTVAFNFCRNATVLRKIVKNGINNGMEKYIFLWHHIEGIMFTADLEAAFDSLDHQFMLSVLKYYGFKSNFIKCIKILHHNIQSTIVNNGFTTGYFILERGTHQGDPLACYLILATLIRNNRTITGINIHGLEGKICMFADETTIFVKNSQSLKAVLKMLSEFAMVSF